MTGLVLKPAHSFDDLPAADGISVHPAATLYIGSTRLANSILHVILHLSQFTHNVHGVRLARRFLHRRVLFDTFVSNRWIIKQEQLSTISMLYEPARPVFEPWQLEDSPPPS